MNMGSSFLTKFLVLSFVFSSVFMVCFGQEEDPSNAIASPVSASISAPVAETLEQQLAKLPVGIRREWLKAKQGLWKLDDLRPFDFANFFNKGAPEFPKS
jgi:hypothetical protein